MGIQGLLPFVEKSSRKVNISEFSGCTVAVDAYCWLHKGAFSCAEKLARGEKTDQYVVYCMKFVNMLLSHNIKPILVFDGQHLPAKADTEKIRREKRESNKRKAAELLRTDQADEARVLIRRCVDVTHEMALALIKQCRSQNVDCIVAPYEADAQLAYLNISKISHLVITEDSDLLLFGCKMVIFKMDIQGNGILVQQSSLPLAMKQRPEQFSIDKFRYMCILAGCDYLPSLPGIGLAKACKFIKRISETDMKRALTRLGGYLNMPGLNVTQEYINKFLQADAMFQHQPVFDPFTRSIVPLKPIASEELLPLECPLSTSKAIQLAYGNLDPFSHKVVDHWDPNDPPVPLRSGSSWKISCSKHKSIWSNDFTIPPPWESKKSKIIKKSPVKVNEVVVQSVKALSTKIQNLNKKKMSPEDEIEVFKKMYEVKSPPLKKACAQMEEIEESNIIESSPIAKNSRNPFRKSLELSPSFKPGCGALSKLGKKTIIDEKNIVQSRYFRSSDHGDVVNEKAEITSSFEVVANCGRLFSNISSQTGNKSETVTKFGASINRESTLNLIQEKSPTKVMVDGEDSPVVQPQLLNECFRSNVTPPREEVDVVFIEEVNSKTGEVIPSSIPILPFPPIRRNIFALEKKEETPTTDTFYSGNKHSFLSLIDSISGITSENISQTKKIDHSSFKWSKKNPYFSGKHNEVEEVEVRKEGSSDTATILTPPLSQEAPCTKEHHFSTPSQKKKVSKLKKSIIHPARRVGLNKKKSGVPRNQTSLLTMFAFQPKAKLSLN